MPRSSPCTAAWVVASSSVREGWGMTLTEAAACGTPAVATRIAGHVDAVDDGVSGPSWIMGASTMATAGDGAPRRRDKGAPGRRGPDRAGRLTWNGDCDSRSRCSPGGAALSQRTPVCAASGGDAAPGGSDVFRRLSISAWRPWSPCPSHPGAAADTKSTYIDPSRRWRAPSMWDEHRHRHRHTRTSATCSRWGRTTGCSTRSDVPTGSRSGCGSVDRAASPRLGRCCSCCGRSRRLRGPGIVVAALAYMLTPVRARLLGRISVILLPFGGAAVADRRWRA